MRRTPNLSPSRPGGLGPREQMSSRIRHAAPRGARTELRESGDVIWLDTQRTITATDKKRPTVTRAREESQELLAVI